MGCPDENEIAEFLQGQRSPEDSTRIEDHIDSCARCYGLVQELARLGSTGSGTPAARVGQGLPSAGSAAAPLGTRFTRGDAVGRYIVLAPVGAGGMGEVYAAYDPELDRKVALKLVGTRHLVSAAGADTRARLLREAQAMARLAHPNVITVYDVGTFEEEVFIAMEFVGGGTLGRWLRERARTRDEILEIFRSAGRGLAAAHAAGLVHRDFKPDNVLLGKDSRVLVTDFGLARTAATEALAAEAKPGALAPEQPRPSRRSALLLELTDTGALLGTPAYMAPEQYGGGPVDARTDQFSFCVALYEALYGERPFAGRSLKEIASAVNQGQVRQAPAGSRVPSWLRAVVLKGLRASPQERHPSMRALLAALEQDPRKTRLRWLGRGASAIVLLVLGALVFKARREPPALCKGAERHLLGVWDEDRRRAIGAAFRATGVPYAVDVWRGVERTLDAYTERWVKARTEACEATRVRGEQSEALLDLRMQCLDQRLSEVQALTEVFRHADAKVNENAVSAAAALSGLEECADARALTARVPPPAGTEVRARIDVVRGHLARATALDRAGKYQQAKESAKAAVELARATHYRPIEAEALLEQGRLEENLKDHRAAEQTLYEALGAAEAGRHDEVAAWAWVELVHVVGYRLARYEEGHRLGRLAEGAVERLGEAPEARAILLANTAKLLIEEGRFQEARSCSERALAIQEKHLGPEHPALRTPLKVLSVALTKMGRFEEALTAQRRAVALGEKVFGPEHPSHASGLGNVAAILEMKGDLDQAESIERRVLAIFERAYGPEHPDVTRSLVNLAETLFMRGDFQGAAAMQQRALAIQEKTLAALHPELAASLGNLARMLDELGRGEEALACIRRALAINEKAFGPEHPSVADGLNALGAMLGERGQLEEALALLQRALAIRAKTQEAALPFVATNHDDLAVVLRKQGKLDEALREHRRALAIAEQSLPPEHFAVAAIHHHLGRTQRERGESAQARASYERALAIREKVLGMQHPEVADTLAELGQLYLDQRQPDEAVPLLDRADTICANRFCSPVARGRLRFLLAHSLSTRPEGRVRAQSLLADARALFAKSGRVGKQEHAALTAWRTRLRTW